MIAAEVTDGGVLGQVGRRSRPRVQREELRSPIRSVDDDVLAVAHAGDESGGFETAQMEGDAARREAKRIGELARGAGWSPLEHRRALRADERF
jgi:hypothetical protein